MRKFLTVVTLVTLTGCATGIQVAYHSDPPGATLYQDGKPRGATPTVLTYPVDQAFKAGGCTKLRGTSVKWASGARAEVSYLTVCAKHGYEQHYTFSRPDVAGREIDMNYALQLQRNGIMRQQAEAAQTAATLQFLNTINPPPNPMLPRPMDCLSYRAGNTVRTECQ
jgi:hypothetical protein